MPQRYTFILSAIKIETELPFEIAPNHWIDKATETQIEKIRSLLDENTRRFIRSPYEHDYSAEPGNMPGNINYYTTPLFTEELRYYVINFEGINSELQTLQQAFLVIPNEVQFGFLIVEEPLSGGFEPDKIDTFYNQFSLQDRIPKSISLDDLKFVSEVYAKRKEFPNEFEHISRAFFRFERLSVISIHSELYVIGMFSVIEMLLTHAPKPEFADALTHQIATKFPLVRKRFIRPIDHQTFFPGIDEAKLWEKLYAYRSKIVHGEDTRIEGKIQVLRDRTNVLNFLREATKLLLIASLREPVLMTDLKKC